MKETQRGRITVTSSLNEISTAKLGNSTVVRGRDVCPTPSSQQASRQIFKDDVNDVPYTLNISFMEFETLLKL
jgi:hypothetical protein